MTKLVKTKGTRAEVMHGTALKTGYGRKGLRKHQLKYNKHGRIVSRRLSKKAKRENRLGRAGWKVKKGVFGSFHVSGKKTRSRRRSRRRRRRKTGKRRRRKTGKRRRKSRRRRRTRRRRKKRKGCRTSKGRFRKC